LSFGVWEHLGIENEITPMEGFEPKAVEMENFDRNISRFHALKKGVNSILIIIRGETSAQPQSKTPSRYLARFAGQY
jgi:hypothetical protein